MLRVYLRYSNRVYASLTASAHCVCTFPITPWGFTVHAISLNNGMALKQVIVRDLPGGSLWF